MTTAHGGRTPGSFSALVRWSAAVFALRAAGTGLTYITYILLARWMGRPSSAITSSRFPSACFCPR
jgi:hypothetical protein